MRKFFFFPLLKNRFRVGLSCIHTNVCTCPFSYKLLVQHIWRISVNFFLMTWERVVCIHTYMFTMAIVFILFLLALKSIREVLNFLTAAFVPSDVTFDFGGGFYRCFLRLERIGLRTSFVLFFCFVCVLMCAIPNF